jgi:uridine kinase
MRANERVLVQDVEQIKITLAIKMGYMDDYNNYVKEYNKHYFEKTKSKIDSIISYIREMGLKKRPLKTYNNKRLSERQIKR